MEQGEQKAGGLSKGCLVGLIIAGVVLVLAIIGGVLVYIYFDDLTKFSAKTVLSETKAMVAANPPEDLDTVQFNAAVDKVIVGLEEQPIETEQLAYFMQEIQPVISDKEFDMTDYDIVMSAIEKYFPHLDVPIMSDSLIDDNSLMYDSTVSQ